MHVLCAFDPLDNVISGDIRIGVRAASVTANPTRKSPWQPVDLYRWITLEKKTEYMYASKDGHIGRQEIPRVSACCDYSTLEAGVHRIPRALAHTFVKKKKSGI